MTAQVNSTSGTAGIAVQACADNTDAAVGYYGEYFSQTRTSPVTLAVTASDNLTASPIVLTAGDWELSFTSVWVPGVGASLTQAGFSTSSATITGTSGIDYVEVTNPGSEKSNLVMASYRVSIASTQTWYAVIFATGAATFQITGKFAARRIR